MQCKECKFIYEDSDEKLNCTCPASIFYGELCEDNQFNLVEYENCEYFKKDEEKDSR